MSRVDHLNLLRELLAAPASEEGSARDDGLETEEREAFEDMLAQLEAGRRVLSDLQFQWASSRHQQLLCGDPAKRNASVPRGKEVERPAVLRNLPKAPPGRRVSQ